MRKVKVFENVIIEEACLENNYRTKWERRVLCYGWFHGVATEGEVDSEVGGELYPVAIVELEDGNLITPTVNLIQFIEQPRDSIIKQNKDLSDWAKTTASNKHQLGGL